MTTDRTIYLGPKTERIAIESASALVRIADAVEALTVFVTGKPVEPPMASEEPEEPAALPETSGEAATPPPGPEEPPITKADLRAYLMTKDKDAVKNLFMEFGVTKFSEIPEDRYPEVLERAKTLPDKEAA